MTDTSSSTTDPKPAWRVTIEAPNNPDSKPVVLEALYRQHSPLSDKHPAAVVCSRLLADGSVLYELAIIVEGPPVEPEKLKGLSLMGRDTAEHMFLLYGDADERL